MLKKVVALLSGPYFDENISEKELGFLAKCLDQKNYDLLLSTLDSEPYAKYWLSFSGTKDILKLYLAIAKEQVSFLKISQDLYLYPLTKQQLILSIEEHRLDPFMKIIFQKDNKIASFFNFRSTTKQFYPFTYFFENKTALGNIKEVLDLKDFIETFLIVKTREGISRAYQHAENLRIEAAQKVEMEKQKNKTYSPIITINQWIISLVSYPIRLLLQLVLTENFVNTNKHWFKIIIPKK